LYHIAKAHAFTDGNKRSAYVSALIFLSINGLDLLLPENVLELAKATLKAEAGEIDKKQLAGILRRLKRRSGQTVEEIREREFSRKKRKRGGRGRGRQKRGHKRPG